MPGQPTREPENTLDTSAEVTNPMLLSAAQRVLGDSLANSNDTTNWAEAADELASVTLAVQAVVATGKHELGSAGSEYFQRMLARLESEVLKDEDVSSATDFLSRQQVLDALQQIRTAVSQGQTFRAAAKHFSGPEGADLVAEIAHDLRSPLTAILTLAETLRRGQSGDVNEIQRRQLGLIYSAALALSSTASDLIELAHAGDRLAQKDPSPFSVTEMLESVRDIVYPLAEEKGLSLRFQSEVSEWRIGYPLALSRVLLNLTTNALKFTEEGFVEIAVSPAPTGPKAVEFSIRDTGKGIDPASLETLYQPFRRIAGRDGYCFSGTGLGLVICRRLVDAMGSVLQLETRKAWGSRFYFQLDLPTVDTLA